MNPTTLERELVAERPITAAAPLTIAEENALIGLAASTEKVQKVRSQRLTGPRAWQTSGDPD